MHARVQNSSRSSAIFQPKLAISDNMYYVKVFGLFSDHLITPNPQNYVNFFVNGQTLVYKVFSHLSMYCLFLILNSGMLCCMSCVCVALW